MSKPDYIYLFQRTTHVRSLQHQIKIGVSNNPTRRLESVQETVKGEVSQIMLVKMPGAYVIEDRLHDLFGASRFKMKRRSKKTNGETEWFYLNWLEIITLMCWIRWYQIRIYVWIVGFVVVSTYMTWAWFLG